MRQPREGTFDYTVRDVAQREGWSEQTAKAILRDGIDNGHAATRRQERITREGLERIRDEGGQR
jgi:predicted transcriptional regulator